jgi:hypothetical protein
MEIVRRVRCSALIAYGLLCITGNSMYEAFSPA